MTREQVLNSIVLKKRFCKDCNLPISVFDNPYFEERIKLLNRLWNFNCVEEFDAFCYYLEGFNSEQDYLEYYNSVKDDIITFIQNNDAFKTFVSDMDSPQYKVHPQFPSRNLYVEENAGKTFISIDMKKANFSALRYYNPDIFCGCETWMQFVQMFTDSKHICLSKYIRQASMGACNPKVQIRYEKYIMNDLARIICEEYPNTSVYAVNTDEIIISVNDTDGGFEMQSFYDFVFHTKYKSIVRISQFRLEKIANTKGWNKLFLDASGMCGFAEFKCLSSDIYPQIARYELGEEPTENDLVFYHDGRLARYMEAIENPWKR